MLSKSVLIVGAGLSGLLAATKLRQNGFSVTLLEKSRGVGGRMATRRQDDAVFDHGCQFFTARSETFKAMASQWAQQGVARKWFDPHPKEVGDAGHPRYRGEPSMTAVAKSLSADLDVRRGEKVVKASQQYGKWTVETESGNTYEASFLLLTAPVPQTLEFLEASSIPLPEQDAKWLKSIRYQKTLTALALLDGKSGLPYEGLIRPDEREPLGMITDNQIKGISKKAVAITLHSGPAFAERYFDAPEEEWRDLLVDAAKPYLKANVVSVTTHRWRYANSLGRQDQLCYYNPPLQLFLAGDGFGGPRAEGAALSGLFAAEKLIALVQ